MAVEFIIVASEQAIMGLPDNFRQRFRRENRSIIDQQRHGMDPDVNPYGSELWQTFEVNGSGHVLWMDGSDGQYIFQRVLYQEAWTFEARNSDDLQQLIQLLGPFHLEEPVQSDVLEGFQKYPHIVVDGDT